MFPNISPFMGLSWAIFVTYKRLPPSIKMDNKNLSLLTHPLKHFRMEKLAATYQVDLITDLIFQDHIVLHILEDIDTYLLYDLCTVSKKWNVLAMQEIQKRGPALNFQYVSKEIDMHSISSIRFYVANNNCYIEIFCNRATEVCMAVVWAFHKDLSASTHSFEHYKCKWINNSECRIKFQSSSPFGNIFYYGLCTKEKLVLIISRFLITTCCLNSI